LGKLVRFGGLQGRPNDRRFSIDEGLGDQRILVSKLVSGESSAASFWDERS
jgi:hypothetical protein